MRLSFWEGLKPVMKHNAGTKKMNARLLVNLFLPLGMESERWVHHRLPNELLKPGKHLKTKNPPSVPANFVLLVKLPPSLHHLQNHSQTTEGRVTGGRIHPSYMPQVGPSRTHPATEMFLAHGHQE